MDLEAVSISAKITRAAVFASQRHAAQRRKGAAEEPYFNHLAEVANLLAQAVGDADVNLTVAGFLHDTIEDAGVTREELVELFGDDVADLVAAVTDDKSLPKERRKLLQIRTCGPGLAPRSIVEARRQDREPAEPERFPADGLVRTEAARILRVGQSRSGWPAQSTPLAKAAL